MRQKMLIAAAMPSFLVASMAAAQTSQRPGAPIRVILSEPKPAPAAAGKTAPPAAGKQAPAAKSAPAAAPAAKVQPAPPPQRKTSPAPAATRAEADRPAKALPRKMPPFPEGPQPGKPETYRRAIEGWREKLEEQRVAWGGGTYPAYRQALDRYQQGVRAYFAAIGRDPPEEKAD